LALTSVVGALMKGQSEEFAVAVVIGVILLGLSSASVNGRRRRLTRVPDIVVTLAMSFVWPVRASCSRPRAAVGEVAQGARDGVLFNEWIPGCANVLPSSWRSSDPCPPLAARPVDLLDRQQPARGRPQRVSVGRTRIAAYMLTGFRGVRGLPHGEHRGSGRPSRAVHA
jgi:ribose/xylose/arabinose/galactoside ABC-type transport system permease subunit